MSRLGPPAGAGRWSLVAPLLDPAPSPTEAAHAKARQLLERYGVLTREAALGEGSEGGFAGVYPVLKALEERGELRRGYFVAGLGAAQFALPGAVDRLRAARDPDDARRRVVVLGRHRPGPALRCRPARGPTRRGRPARQAGAHVLLVDGELVAYLERGGHSVATFAATADHPEWPELIKALVDHRAVPHPRDPQDRWCARRRVAVAATRWRPPATGTATRASSTGRLGRRV